MEPVPASCPAQPSHWRGVGITFVVLFVLLSAGVLAAAGLWFFVWRGRRRHHPCHEHERMLLVALDSHQNAVATSEGYRAAVSLYRSRHARVLAELEALRADRLEHGYALEGLKQGYRVLQRQLDESRKERDELLEQLRRASSSCHDGEERDRELDETRLTPMFANVETGGEWSPYSPEMRIEHASPYRVVGKGKATLITPEDDGKRLSVTPALGEVSGGGQPAGAPRDLLQGRWDAAGEEDDHEPFHPDVLAFLSVCLPPGESDPSAPEPTPGFVVGDDSDTSSDY